MPSKNPKGSSRSQQGPISALYDEGMGVDVGLDRANGYHPRERSTNYLKLTINSSFNSKQNDPFILMLDHDDADDSLDSNVQKQDRYMVELSRAPKTRNEKCWNATKGLTAAVSLFAAGAALGSACSGYNASSSVGPAYTGDSGMSNNSQYDPQSAVDTGRNLPESIDPSQGDVSSYSEGSTYELGDGGILAQDVVNNPSQNGKFDAVTCNSENQIAYEARNFFENP